MSGTQRRSTVTDRLSFALALLFASALLVLLAASAALDMPQYAALAIVPLGALGVAMLLWHRPIVAIGALFGAAVLIEANGTRFPDATTELIPIWRNLSSSGLAPLPFSPAELLVGAMMFVWCLRMVCLDRFRVYGSPLLRSYSAYLVCVGAGLVFGVATGGNFTVALWEVRTPILCGVVLLLALNLVRTTRHVDALGWIILLGSGLKGVQGTWRYVVTLDRTTGYNNLLEHEEALFFPAFSVFLLLLFMFGGGRWQKRVGVCLLPFVLLADFANQRGRPRRHWWWRWHCWW